MYQQISIVMIWMIYQQVLAEYTNLQRDTFIDCEYDLLDRDYFLWPEKKLAPYYDEGYFEFAEIGLGGAAYSFLFREN